MSYSHGLRPLPFELDESYWKWVESLRKQDSTERPAVEIVKPYEPQPLPVKPPIKEIPFEPFPEPSIPPNFTLDPFSDLFELLKKKLKPQWVELGDFPNVVYEELERQVKPIDPELYQYMVNVPKNSYTLDIVIKSMISVGSYPYARKIQEMKKAFLGGVDALSSLTRFFYARYKSLPSSGAYTLFFDARYESLPSPDTRTLILEPIDPEEPDAPLVPPELEKDENERRYRWARAWLEYARRFERRLFTELGKDMYVVFSCDLPYGKVKPKISPRLRLPSGEYLEPVTVTATILPVGPVVPQPLPISPPPTEIPIVPLPVEPVNPQPQPVAPVTETPVGGMVPVSEEKKDEKTEKKKFPWWIVIVIGVVVLFFIMKD